MQTERVESQAIDLRIGLMFREIISYNRGALHHELHVLQESDIRDRVAAHRYDVREFADCYFAYPVTPAHQFRGVNSAASNDVQDWHPLILKLF